MRNELNQFEVRNRLSDNQLYQLHVEIYTVAERVNCVRERKVRSKVQTGYIAFIINSHSTVTPTNL